MVQSPISKNVIIKVSHYLLKLLNRHFPRQHKLHRILNKNTVKVSYSCTKNIKSINNSHNEKFYIKILHFQTNKSATIEKKLCPLKASCQGENFYIIPRSHAMNKTTASIFIQVQQKLHFKIDTITIKDFLIQQRARMILNFQNNFGK